MAQTIEEVDRAWQKSGLKGYTTADKMMCVNNDIRPEEALPIIKRRIAERAAVEALEDAENLEHRVIDKKKPISVHVTLLFSENPAR